jgi:broad specificity phosphatase PhoE
MRKLILIKHASPLVIPGTPPEQWKLSDKGKETCIPLAEALREYAPTVVVASQEPKARETGEIVAARLGVPFDDGPDLHEHDRTNVPHMRSGEFISHMELLFRHSSEHVLGRESADEALERFESAMESVLNINESGNVAVVSHGTVIALYVARYGQQKPFELWRKMGLPSFVVMSLPQRSIERVVEKIAT